MPSYLLTLILAFALILCATILLGIGYLLTGQKKLRPNMCGKRPQKGEKCDKQAGECPLCGEKTSESDTDDKLQPK
jgi:hypothetical protein